MSGRNTEQMIQELAREARPVRAIPRVRTVFALVIGAWLAVVAIDWGLGPLRRNAWAALDGSDPRFASVLAGLALAALGGTIAALTSAVPGREGDTRRAAAVACFGVAAAAAGGLWTLAVSADSGATGAFACLGHAAVLAFLPATFAALFLARGAPHRPRFGAGLAVCGAVASGALVIHASCLAGGGLHVLLGHALAPAVLGIALALPLAALVRGLRRAA